MVRLYVGNCIDVLRTFDAESIHCVVTSPPYWGLRRYDGAQEAIWPCLDAERPDCDHEWVRAEVSRSHHDHGTSTLRGSNAEQTQAGAFAAAHATCAKCGAWRGPFGLEPTPELYVEHTVYVLREIRRVLRRDGTVWWNIGDTYFGSWGNYGARNGKQRTRWKERYPRDAWEDFTGRPPMAGVHTMLKPKDLCAIPFRVALAAQADGWWLRSVVVWDKPNAMPESVKDRPTESHEYVILLAKSERYFYDADAVREPHDPATIERCGYRWANRSKYDSVPRDQVPSWVRTHEPSNFAHPSGRNMRTVWRFPTQPYPGMHFAVFPPELPRRCILAGTSPMVCAACGAPWRRIVQRDPRASFNVRVRDALRGRVAAAEGYRIADWEREAYDKRGRRINGSARRVKTANQDRGGKRLPPEPGEPNAFYTARTIGWQPTCTCRGELEKTVGARDWPTSRAIVLDPFAGSGTTLAVAAQLGRDAIGIEIAAEYVPLVRERCGMMLDVVGG